MDFPVIICAFYKWTMSCIETFYILRRNTKNEFTGGEIRENMAKLTIEVSAEDLDKAMEKAYQKQKSRISLPGFRKGKAPRKMIESMYGKRCIYGRRC